MTRYTAPSMRTHIAYDNLCKDKVRHLRLELGTSGRDARNMNKAVKEHTLDKQKYE